MAEREVVAAAAEELDFVQLNDLACERNGGRVIFATDEWFAPAANLLKRDAPQFDSSAFTDFGKWMDGWETRRKRTAGFDWCIIQLGVPGVIHGLDVDTSFFTGNHAPHVSIQAACLNEPPDLTLEGDRTGMAASDSQLAAVATLCSESWAELVPISQLKPGYSDSCHNYFRVGSPARVTHLRLNLYPDGGVARLRVYGIGQRDWSSLPGHMDIDLVALANGGVCLGYSDAHFGHPRNMIGPGRAVNMADGWETARRLDRPKQLKTDERGILQQSGWEWAMFRLGHPGLVTEIHIDTNHFKGNFPDSCRMEACCLTLEEEVRSIRDGWNHGKWEELLPPQKLRPHHVHVYRREQLVVRGAVSHVRLVIAPDGGVSRLRLWGRPTPTSATTTPGHQRPSAKL